METPVRTGAHLTTLGHITKTTASPHHPGRPPERTSPAQEQSPSAGCGDGDGGGGGPVGSATVVRGRLDVCHIRPVSLSPLWQAMTETRLPLLTPRGTAGPGGPGEDTVVTPCGAGEPGQHTVVTPCGAGDPGQYTVASNDKDSDTTERVARPNKCVETLDEVDIRERPGSCRRLCVGAGSATLPAPSTWAEEELMLLRKGEGPLLRDATRRDRHALHFTDDIPFMDDDDDDDADEPEPVLLRSKRTTTDPAARLKRRGGHMTDSPAAATLPRPSPTWATSTKAKELVIYRRKKRESPAKAKRQAWFVGAADEVAGAGPCVQGEGGRPTSLDPEALEALLHQLMTTKTAAEAAGSAPYCCGGPSTTRPSAGGGRP